MVASIDASFVCVPSLTQIRSLYTLWTRKETQKKKLWR